MAKIIKAVFGVGETTRVCPQWQYDYNTILQFVGLDLPATFEVDLANSKTGQSTTVLGDADGCCTIPAQYFIPGTSIFAWAYIVDSNSGYTRCQVEIPISPRAQHTGDPPTPEQQSALDQAIALLNAATDNIPNEINAALAEAKESGEFDGKNGNNAWTVDAEYVRTAGGVVQAQTQRLVGPSGATVKIGDIVFVSDGRFADVTATNALATRLSVVGNLRGDPGEDGYSPTVTITEITGGHRVTITDEDHPDGQDFDVPDGQDGYSPVVTVADIPGGHRVTITDAEGSHVFDVLDGQSAGSGLTEDIKQAMLQIAQKVAYIDDQGASYYQDLYDALYPSASLVSISALYTQSSTVYPSTQLDSLKTDLVVTGTYDDSSTATIPATDYTLSGTLTVGTSTITVTSGGKTTTFSVTVTAAPTLSSITAVYTQSGTVYTTDTLDSLKADLVVTAHYSDSSTAIVPAADYALSGTLTEGTSTITVSYGGKATTFNVTVSSAGAQLLHSWDFTQSLVDSVSGLTATTTATRDANGLSFTASHTYLELPGVFQRNRTYEMDVVSIQRVDVGSYGRIWVVDGDPNTGSGGAGFVITGTKKQGDLFYLGAWESTIIVSRTDDPDGSFYDGSTLAFQVDADGYISVYKNGVLLGTSSGAISTTYNGQNVYIGGNPGDVMNASTFTAYRIYQGAKY